MVMTNTEDKLNEARYFLERMQLAPNTDEFRYNLTACLSAIRSITLIMQKEFNKVDGFNSWYASKQEVMKNDSLLKYVHAQRNLSLHVRPLIPTPFVNIERVFEISSQTTNVILCGTAGTLAYTPRPSVVPRVVASNVKYYFSDIESKDVISLCEEALNILEKIVTECESKFKLD